ncbi:MAG: Gldg family protein [Deltaproteobacteria bacterium]|nr:Gldg family protein [Deltaproteobacteria bacterium]
MNKISFSLGLLWLGIVLLFLGMALTFLGVEYSTWALIGLMTGLLGVLLYVVINYTLVKQFFVEYSTRQWANMIVFVILLVGVLIVVQMIANKHNHRFDLTSEGKLSLAPMTKKVLLEVAAPVKVIGFYRRDEKDELLHLLEMYRLASDKFTYELFDLDRTPALAEKYDVSAYGTAVVLIDNKLKRVKFPTEEKIINAVLSLVSPEQKVVYFLTGHGEHTLEGLEEDTPSYGVVKQDLETENYLVRQSLFVGGKPIPDDAAAVVVGGPKRDFTTTEVKQFEEYLQRGGSVFFALDPDFEKGELTSFLERYEVDVGDDIVVDPEDYLIEKGPMVPIIPFYIAHKITEDFTTPTVFPLVRSVGKGTTKIKGLNMKSLARSSEKSWAESDVKSAEEGTYEFDHQDDQKGPITVAMVGEIPIQRTENENTPGDNNRTEAGSPASSDATDINAKIVIFGDSQFLLNQYIELMGNKDLFLNTIHWMTEEESLISIRKKKPSQEDLAPVYISPMSARMIFIGVVVFLPVIVVAIGLVVAWRRRQKG